MMEWQIGTKLPYEGAADRSGAKLQYEGVADRSKAAVWSNAY